MIYKCVARVQQPYSLYLHTAVVIIISCCVYLRERESFYLEIDLVYFQF